MLTHWEMENGVPLGIMPQWPINGARGLFSFRHGGVSGSPFARLNVGLHVGDDEGVVRINRERCANILGVSLPSFVFAEQPHGHRVAVVDEMHRGCGALDVSTAIADVDALVTQSSEVTLAVIVADCVPILFYDPVRRVVATAHSGWKGTLNHISRNVIETMTSSFGCYPKDVLACIGPSIRRCCYEVDEKVAYPMQQTFGRRIVTPRFGVAGKWWLSLQSAVKQDLHMAGVQAIWDYGLCTSCRTNDLFSHRKELGQTGRFLGAIRLT